jgi:N-acyl-D-amino-acid deacylase
MARALRAAASLFLLALPAVPRGEGAAAPFDVLIRNGTMYDGSGAPPVIADVGMRGDRIVAVGKLHAGNARTVVDAKGLAVAPGFINMLSWSNESLIVDGRSQGEIRQGVTLEILGEGTSMGPLNADMKKRLRAGQIGVRYDVEWTTLAEYLAWLEKRGISTNVASFIGMATIRTHVLGLEDVQPTAAQLERMRALVRKEMEAGALGVGSALIYPPGSYAKTEELIELCKVAAKYGGMYTSHIRDEGENIFEALDELFRISSEAGIRAEIHHLKVAGRKNWDKIDGVIERIERARAKGLPVTANMYMYPASSNGLWSQIPAWAHSGGPEALFKRLAEPATRERIAKEMRRRGKLSRTILVKLHKPELRPLIGRTLEDVAKERGTDEVDAILDLVLQDRSRIQAVYFGMSEANLAKELRQPWVAIGSDGSSTATEGVFLEGSTHPRSYGNFARLLGKFVREEKVIPLEEAIRRMTGLPGSNLKIEGRGLLKQGMYADVVVFDPATIADKATYENPHQYAVGMKHVFVNGVQVLKDGEHTGAKPGRAVWGPGRLSQDVSRTTLSIDRRQR